jgi:PqqD family protein of HPr-rel-A system
METPLNDLDNLRELAISDTGFVFDPYSGSSFTVNATGALILQLLKGGATRATIVAKLQSEFEHRGEDMNRDVDEFVHVLRQDGLVPKTFTLE